MQRNVEFDFRFFDAGTLWTSNSEPFQDDIHGFVDFLKATERRRWIELYQNLKRDHPIEIARLTAEAQKRLDQLRLDDLDELWSLRVNQTCRAWGYRYEHELRLIWIDPEHMVYPVDFQDRDGSRAG